MRILYVLLIVCFFSCNSTKEVRIQKEPHRKLNEQENKVLLFLEDSLEINNIDKRITYYKKMNLKRVKIKSSMDVKYFLNDELIFINKGSECHILKQVFEHSILFQKSLNYTEFQPSSIPAFERSEFFIFDTQEQRAFQLKLEAPINLFYSKQQIFDDFVKESDEEFNKYKQKTYVVEDINLEDKTISFFGLNHKTVTYNLIPVGEYPIVCTKTSD